MSDTASTGRRPRVLVVGAGGIGGTLAGTLIAEGACELTALTTNEQIAEAVRARGFLLTGVAGERTVRGRCVSTVDESERFDWVLLATQPPQVEQAARLALPYLAPEGMMVCLQNGLCEARVERIAGRGRVVGAVVAWGASMPSPGVYERTSKGGFVLGMPDGSEAPALVELASLLGAVGLVERTQNLRGARWSKLAINCAISTLGTLGGDRLGPLMRHAHVRTMALLIMTEVVEVARAEGIALEKVSKTLELPWIALRDEQKRSRSAFGRALRHAVLFGVGLRFRRMRSSMLAAIERGRTPAVDFLNGEVVELGRVHGLATPVNAAAQELVHAVARGEAKMGLATLGALAQGLGVSR